VSAAAAAFMAADTDKDGKVDRDEFVGLLQSPAAG
jgi:Ca2+-binding EF-hand superfamily protein